jgi:hypothetical protein
VLETRPGEAEKEKEPQTKRTWYGQRYVPADKEKAGESESEEEAQTGCAGCAGVAAGLVLSLFSPLPLSLFD